MNSKQVQQAGEGSTLIQAGTLNVGVTYSDARQIAQDVFEANFLKLRDEAYILAFSRMEKFTDNFLRKLVDRKPEALGNARNPGAQRALYRAQEEYACSGDKVLGELLVDLLVDRFAERDRSFFHLVLDEALKTIPKLTTPQIATLSLIFYARQVVHTEIEYQTAIDAIHKNTVKYLKPIGRFACSEIDLRHLEYSGCVSLSLGQVLLEETFLYRYPGSFSKGINPHAVPDKLASLFPPHPNLSNLLHIPVVDRAQLSTYLDSHAPELTDLERRQIENLFNSSHIAKHEIASLVAGGDERLAEIFAAWNSTQLRSAEPTSIGTVIGHANLRRSIEDFDAPLEVWLKEHGAK